MAGLARDAAESSLMERNRFLSQASAALDTSSRRKTSRLEYSELMMMSITRPTSAWNSKVSAPSSTVSASTTTLSDMAKGLNVLVEKVVLSIIRCVIGTDGTNAPTATAEARTQVAAWESFMIDDIIYMKDMKFL